MTTSTHQADAGRQARYVFVDRPRCPFCGSASLKTHHSDRQGDGTVTRRSVCRDCGETVYVVVE